MFILNPIKVTVKGNQHSLRLVRDRVGYCTKTKCVVGTGGARKVPGEGFRQSQTGAGKRCAANR